ncbi:MAG: hypothetical protein GEU74_11685 [Nitriliruptorales bacterium]|nr:hypothetical protein [Nitriliruptorales bacterium]
MELTAEEVRVLGCLAEKHRHLVDEAWSLTPAQVPNALGALGEQIAELRERVERREALLQDSASGGDPAAGAGADASP